MSDGILYFSPRTLEMRYVNPAKTDERERLREQGYMENPTLIHMHHPRPAGGQPADINIPVQDQKSWEDKGYYAKPTMIYHPTKGTLMVSEEEAKLAIRNRGFYSSPAHFPGNDIGFITTPNVSQDPINEAPKNKGGRPKANTLKVDKSTNDRINDVMKEAS